MAGGRPCPVTDQISGTGFAVVRDFLDADQLRQLRALIVGVMHQHGWVEAGSGAVPSARAQREGGDRWWHGYAAIQGVEELHRLGHDRRLLHLMQDTFGADVLSHNRRIVGLTLPGYGTPPHQDYVSVQGSADTLTVWIPLDDRDGDCASIRLLPVGAEPRLKPLEWADGISAQVAVDPLCDQWLQPSVRVGDAVVYHGLTVHELRPNLDDSYRIACELRFQPLSDPVCGASLKPHHFPRIPDWPALTSGWRCPRLIDIPDDVVVAAFHMPRRIERWHAELTVPPSRLLRAGVRSSGTAAEATETVGQGETARR
jgi:hypothetical protein